MPNARHRPHKDLLAAIGANVRRLRASKGLTQERLAELVDVHPRMVQKIEYGQTNLLATTAIRLHAALGCGWDELMPPLSQPKAPSRSREPVTRT